jgi:hypothetical protein
MIGEIRFRLAARTASAINTSSISANLRAGGEADDDPAGNDTARTTPEPIVWLLV